MNIRLVSKLRFIFVNIVNYGHLIVINCFLLRNDH